MRIRTTVGRRSSQCHGFALGNGRGGTLNGRRRILSPRVEHQRWALATLVVRGRRRIPSPR
jgi:hypothetical protein